MYLTCGNTHHAKFFVCVPLNKWKLASLASSDITFGSCYFTTCCVPLTVKTFHFFHFFPFFFFFFYTKNSNLVLYYTAKLVFLVSLYSNADIISSYTSYTLKSMHSSPRNCFNLVMIIFYLLMTLCTYTVHRYV